MEQSQPQDELSKLVEISQRCKDYFIKFLDEKEQIFNKTAENYLSLINSCKFFVQIYIQFYKRHQNGSFWRQND